MPEKTFSRHGTLAEAIRSHLEVGNEFRYHLASFLDEFYLDRCPTSRAERLADAPVLTGNSQFDALIGAIGEHLSRRWRLGTIPDWTEQPERFLKSPCFLGAERMKPVYLVESPSAYRRRFLFTEMEPLRRARMPRDAQWWHGETIRTGITPLPEDIEPRDLPQEPLIASVRS